MKNLCCAVFALCAALVMAETQSLDGGWQFAKDPDGKLEAAAPDFDDSGWQTVRVPHDWAISGPFDPKSDGGTGMLPWRGVGWYRRTAIVPADCAGESVYLDFDGVMASPKVYVNGRLAGGWDYGYMSFRVDATPFFKFGKPNVIAVRADTRDHHSRWYPGAGMYRGVRLSHCPAVQFVHGATQIISTNAVVQVNTAVTNRSAQAAKCAVRAEVDGQAFSFPAATIAAGGALLLSHDFTIKSPKLWDVDSPYLYTATLTAEANGKADTESVRFGIRSIAFPANDGFHLNGRRVQIHGVDLHSDLGPLGMAFNKSAMRRQLSLMKGMGVNALRTSHNPPAPEVLDLCDEMGIVVWDECFDKWDGTSGRRGDQNLEEYVSRNLRQFVRRDRNHPCVIVWSMYNEICGVAKPDDPKSPLVTRARCKAFRDDIRALDTTRPVGCGNIYFMGEMVSKTGALDDLDITGWNYGGIYKVIKAHAPDKPVLYSESASALSTYGFYELPPAAGIHDYADKEKLVGSYDHNAGPDIPDKEFERMETDTYCGGEFVWTGIDYLGEPTPYWKECRSSFFGICDLMGVPKDRYYLYRSYWNPQVATVHILPHWNWAGREGRNVPVYVYTSGDSAELFLNGRSLGRRVKGQPQPKLVNLVAGKPCTASTWERTDVQKNPASNAVDGNGDTRWCASSANAAEWWQADLGASVPFRFIALSFERESKLYACEVRLSDDQTNWKTVFAKKVGESADTVEGDFKARYVRVVFTGMDNGAWASLREVCVNEKAIEPFRLNPYYDVCDKYRLRWLDVPYQPGELKVVAYKDGKKIGEDAMRTAGKAVAVKLTPESDTLPADGDSIVFVQVDVVDAKGTRDPLAMSKVVFKLEGPAEILAVGNGDPRGFDSFTATASHPLFYGKAVCVLRRLGEAGPVKLTVSSDGLTPATSVFK